MVSIFASLFFIFLLGLVYALLRPEGILIQAVFLLIAIGWGIFAIHLLWDYFDKKKI